jgi:hypothetical protein
MTPPDALAIGQQLATLQQEQDALVAFIKAEYRTKMVTLHAAYIRAVLASAPRTREG